MITPDTFRENWCNDEDSLVVFAPESLVDVKIPDSSKTFLMSAGLPESASPFLDFFAPTGGTLETVSRMWQISSEFDRYRVIGSNGSGDPICIDESCNGQIVYLNHDNDFCRILLNSSVSQLAEMLLSFRHLVRETQARNGEDAYLDGNVPIDLQEWFLTEIDRIDPLAGKPGCFWIDEMKHFQENEI
ncbi:MAG: SUKH-4 family immunity protein [Pirellulales bacterium]|nr:SUKH-4 family immunity protein [Pirellulales bacterium]